MEAASQALSEHVLISLASDIIVRRLLHWHYLYNLVPFTANGL